MRFRTSPADLLLKLPRLAGPAEQEASFRQALTALAQAASAMGPPPLDGVDPEALAAAVGVAFEAGFAERVDFLESGAAAVGLYELSAALGPGPLKRELRRRVFSRLYEGDATAFVPVATRIALGSATLLETPTLRARVGLCLDLPIGTQINVAPLALCLATRAATHGAWIATPSVGALHSRRMAAQLLEHAAREAVFRYQLGDPQPRNLLLEVDCQIALERLLRDREPLVWRHAAVARGLLAAIHAETRERIEQALDPTLGITEWRRGGVSLVASSLLGDEEALRSVHSIISGPIGERDPGILATLVLGLPRVVELEPDHAEAILARLAATRRADVAIAAAELLSQLKDDSFAAPSRAVLRDALSEATRKQSLTERAQATGALKLLGGQALDEGELSARVRAALADFEQRSARVAYDAAVAALDEAHQLADFVEANDARDEISLGSAMAALLEIDSGAIERPVLGNLLLLGRRPGEPDSLVGPLERLKSRVTRWILDGVAHAGHVKWSRDGALADQRRLRVLLHLLDAEAAADPAGSSEHGLERAIEVLLERIEEGPDMVVHRVLCAALARAFDASVRQHVHQIGDLLLVVFATLKDHFSIVNIAEASTAPEVAAPLGALGAFLSPDLQDSGAESSNSTTGMLHDPAEVESEGMAEALRQVGRVLAISQELSSGGGYHAEALRRVVFRLGRALELLAVARSQTELVEPRESGVAVLDELSLAVEDLASMIRFAEDRVLRGSQRNGSGSFDSPALGDLVERAISAGEPVSADEAVRAIDEMVRPLPEGLGHVVAQIAFRIHQLPLEAHSERAPRSAAQRRAPLPDWLLPRRSIGSFHVLRPLGTGGVSSVFLARRIEERNNQQAETFALKVPEYDPSTARSMTEKEFFQMFREEAGALLSLPQQDNLARFVTFDLAARPKPILVMELIRGTPLDRLIRSHSLTMPRVIAYLDGILAALEAMHHVGVGHLDVKPSNVILRGGTTPVLVDFGLSGRKLRPGCGTIEYTAPEVLGVVLPGYEALPPAADVYSFGCLMYEMLTGQLLFDAADELSLVSKHVSHDGWVAELEALRAVPGLDPAARLIGACLRHDPRNRPSATDLRHEVTRALVGAAGLNWPVRAASRASSG
ncbi:MAG TPA: protein kinase [Polyangiaceae bacterium]|nr:protein kinase [Polyangiaceae bacterium]